MKSDKVSLAIIAHSEDRLIGQCLRHHGIYFEEPLVLVDKEGFAADTAREYGARVYVEEEHDIPNSFAARRNFLAGQCETPWILWVDCDELFDSNFLSNIERYIEGDSSIIAFSFPRINLDDHKPLDYHTRLYSVRDCEWRKQVHELVYPKDSDAPVCESPDLCKVLHNCRIAHVQRDPLLRTATRQRWNRLAGSPSLPRVLIASIVGANQERWLLRFLTAIDNLSYPKENITYAFLVGNNDDHTFDLIADFERRKQAPLSWSGDKGKVFLKGLDMPVAMPRFLQLATLRDLLIFEALEKEEYVLMIDSDVVSMPSDLIQQLLRVDAEVAAPLVTIEDFRDFGDDYFYDVLAFIDKSGEHFTHFMPHSATLEDNDKETVYVRSVGTCYLVSSFVFSLGAKYITTEDESEQVSFCNRVRKLGYRVAVNPRVRVLHANFEKFNNGFHE